MGNPDDQFLLLTKKFEKILSEMYKVAYKNECEDALNNYIIRTSNKYLKLIKSERNSK